jgi:hypothetical protein
MAGVVTWVWGPRAAYLLLGALNLIGLATMTLLPLPAAGAGPAKAGQGNGSHGFMILLVAMMLGGIAYRGATVILPAYFELRNAGLFAWLGQTLPTDFSANLVATMITSAIFLVGMFGQYLGGRVAERFSLPYSYLVFHLITIGPAFLMARAADLPLILLALIYFFFLLGMQPIENTLVSLLTPARWRHAAFGMKFVLTFGVGALAVKGVGAIERSAGLMWVYPALGCVSIVLVLSIAGLILKLKPKPKPAVSV